MPPISPNHKSSNYIFLSHSIDPNTARNTLTVNFIQPSICQAKVVTFMKN